MLNFVLNTDSTTNSVHVLTIKSESSTIDGFTISGGYASGTSDGDADCQDCFGGGIYLKNDQQNQEGRKLYLSVSNCIFTDNYAMQGAGIFGYINVEIDVTNCEFTRNRAIRATYHVSGGAAIYVSLQSELSIDQSTFTYVKHILI